MVRILVYFALFGLSLFFGSAAVASAQGGVLIIDVAELKIGRPVEGAEVVILDARRMTRTNVVGIARIDGLSEGTHQVRVRKPGYTAVESPVSIGRDTVRADVYLGPALPRLDTIRVTASLTPPRLRDFAFRHAQGIGRFLDDSLLTREGNRDFSVVAAAHIPGLRIQPDLEGHDRLVSTRGPCGDATRQTRLQMSVSSHGGGRGGGNAGGGEGAGSPAVFGSCTAATTCPIIIYLDDMRLGQDDADLDLIRTWDLAGVEYYTASSVPVRYRTSGAACGVMLLWSR